MVVSSANGSPSFTSAVRFSSFSISSSFTDAATSTRSVAEQAWPELK
jgi:hypothetical protein